LKAIVVFHDVGTGWASRFLRPGFRHVFVAVEADGQWIRIDGMDGLVKVSIDAPADYDLAGYFRAEGYTVVETEQAAGPSGCPFAVANCVGLVKGVLAIRSFAITPYQLFKELSR
jgi:hypothetical protein